MISVSASRAAVSVHAKQCCNVCWHQCIWSWFVSTRYVHSLLHARTNSPTLNTRHTRADKKAEAKRLTLPCLPPCKNNYSTCDTHMSKRKALAICTRTSAQHCLTLLNDKDKCSTLLERHAMVGCCRRPCTRARR
jgi:hypothetical protein